MISVNIQKLIEPLPRALSDQVISYVAAVEDAADAILSDAGIRKTDQAVEALRVLAAIRKIFGIAGMGYWAVDNVLAGKEKYEATAVRIGGAVYSKHTDDYRKLQQLLLELSNGLGERGLLVYVRSGSYSDALREIFNGRQRS